MFSLCCCFFCESECAIKRAELVAKEREAEKEENIVAFLNRPTWIKRKPVGSIKIRRRRKSHTLQRLGNVLEEEEQEKEVGSAVPYLPVTTTATTTSTSTQLVTVLEHVDTAVQVPVVPALQRPTTDLAEAVVVVVDTPCILLLPSSTTTDFPSSSSTTIFQSPMASTTTSSSSAPPSTSSKLRYIRPTPPTLASTPLSPTNLKLLLDKIDSTFAHTPYAVAGLAALAVWGYRPASFPSRITILTSYDSYESLRSWATTAGWFVFTEPTRRDVIGVPFLARKESQSKEDGSLRKNNKGKKEEEGQDEEEEEEEEEEEWRGITLKVLPSADLERLQIVRVRDDVNHPDSDWFKPGTSRVEKKLIRSEARVVGLSSMLELRLSTWLGMDSLAEDQKVDEKTVKDCERQVVWIIKRLARDDVELTTEGKDGWEVSPRTVPSLWRKEIWDGFLGREEGRVTALLEVLGVRRPPSDSNKRDTRIVEEVIWTGSREMRVLRAERGNSSSIKPDTSCSK
ncbi:hypothetical protein QBC43DRAFT_286101 [Cladorrhinum sp. PSN259]|nr:hypothetical protein QBC43DRAFT_286101 [Cladorrhinum sp. PSN259]